MNIIFLCQWPPQLWVNFTSLPAQIGADICLDISLIHKTVRPALLRCGNFRASVFIHSQSSVHSLPSLLSLSLFLCLAYSLVVVLINCCDSARVCKYWNIRVTSVGPRPVIEKFDSCQVENIFRLSSLIYLLIHQIPNLAQCHCHSHSQSRSPNQLAIAAELETMRENAVHVQRFKQMTTN